MNRFPTAPRHWSRLVGSIALVGSLVIAGACSSDDSADSDEAPTSTVADVNLPAMETDPVEGDDGTAEPTPTTEAATDPSVDAVADDTATDRTALDAVKSTAVDPVTGTPVTELELVAAGLPETWSRNSLGVEIRLDEAALLACANNQFAWVELQSSNAEAASGWLAVAAVRADQSEVAPVKAVANELATASQNPAGAAIVDSFLTMCTERGFQV